MFYHSVHIFFEVDNIMYLCYSLATLNCGQQVNSVSLKASFGFAEFCLWFEFHCLDSVCFVFFTSIFRNTAYNGYLNVTELYFNYSQREYQRKGQN